MSDPGTYKVFFGRNPLFQKDTSLWLMMDYGRQYPERELVFALLTHGLGRPEFFHYRTRPDDPREVSFTCSGCGFPVQRILGHRGFVSAACLCSCAIYNENAFRDYLVAQNVPDRAMADEWTTQLGLYQELKVKLLSSLQTGEAPIAEISVPGLGVTHRLDGTGYVFSDHIREKEDTRKTGVYCPKCGAMIRRTKPGIDPKMASCHCFLISVHRNDRLFIEEQAWLRAMLKHDAEQINPELG
jgi:hypothetical protein